jgi:MGT family glycosyltransferase
MKVLAYTSPARGHLFPLVPILDELESRGHSIALRTLASQVELMRERGFAAAPISAEIEGLEHDDYLARSPRGRVKRALAVFTARAQLEIGDLRAAIEAEQPDALLIDAMSWGASAAADARGGPWAQWFPYPLPLPSKSVPPFGPGLRPAAGPLGRLRDSLLRRLLMSSVAPAYLSGVNSARSAAGARPLAEFAEVFTAAPLMLYMTAEPFEYPRADWPQSIRMIGPCAWDPPAEAPAWLAQVERPLVLVCTSSEFQDDGRLVTCALEALAGEDLQVVATLPAAELADANVPSNARVESFIPHTPILARAACVITHGGAGATQKALAAGVPVCVVPFGRDQLEVARRVEVAQAGTRLPAQRLRPARLRAKVLEAMGKRSGARRVADGFAAAGGPVAAADAFESLASDGAPVRAQPPAAV